LRTIAFDASRPHPMTAGLPSDCGVWRRLCREPWETGPFRKPGHLCASLRLTRQGTDGVLGHDRCQGQTSGLRARRQEALILRGGWCGAYIADTTCKKTGVRLRLPVGGGVQQEEHNRKSHQKVYKGEVWPLDRSLLMGRFPIRPATCPLLQATSVGLEAASLHERINTVQRRPPVCRSIPLHHQYLR
jgi:hypothetical protein